MSIKASRPPLVQIRHVWYHFDRDYVVLYNIQYYCMKLTLSSEHSVRLYCLTFAFSLPRLISTSKSVLDAHVLSAKMKADLDSACKRVSACPCFQRQLFPIPIAKIHFWGVKSCFHVHVASHLRFRKHLLSVLGGQNVTV